MGIAVGRTDYIPILERKRESQARWAVEVLSEHEAIRNSKGVSWSPA